MITKVVIFFLSLQFSSIWSSNSLVSLLNFILNNLGIAYVASRLMIGTFIWQVLYHETYYIFIAILIAIVIAYICNATR